MVCERWSIPAVAADVSQVRRRVLDFAAAHGVDEAPIGALRLVLAESMSNAVMHAYDAEQAGTIEIRLAIDPPARRLTVTVVDDGGGLAASSAPGAGYGFSLMRASADTFDVRPARTGHGTEVTVGLSLEPTA